MAVGLLVIFAAAALLSLLMFVVWVIVLVRAYKARARRPRTFAAVIVVPVLFLLASWVPTALDFASTAWQRHEWASVDKAARAGDLRKARKLLAGRQGGFQAYVERAIANAGAVDNALASAAFSACADLLDDRPQPAHLLGKAIAVGASNVIRLWLAQPECGRAGIASRHDRLVAAVPELLSFEVDGTSSVIEADALRLRQADALRVILEHDPALFDVEIDDPRCSRDGELTGFPRCTLVSLLLSQRRAEFMRVLLPLDRHAQAHLQDLTWNVLRGNARLASESARKSPIVLLVLLPDLLATAPFESLKAAVLAARLDESAFLDAQGDRDDALRRIVRGAYQQDAASQGWPRLNLMIDQLPTRLQEVDPRVFYDYVETGDAAASAALVARLHAAGTSCERLNGLAQAWPRSPIDLAAPGTCRFERIALTPYSSGKS